MFFEGRISYDIQKKELLYVNKSVLVSDRK
jgi:hypothetical protein